MTENPNAEACTWYAPSNISGGYDSRFVRIDNVNDFAVDRQDDGSLILYGCLGGEAPTRRACFWARRRLWMGPLSCVRRRPKSSDHKHGGPESRGRIREHDGRLGYRLVECAELAIHRFARAFAGSSVTSVDIDAPSVKFGMEQSAFEGCANLTHVSVTARTLSIGDTAFANCTALKSACFIANESPTSDDVHYLNKNNIGFGGVFG